MGSILADDMGFGKTLKVIATTENFVRTESMKTKSALWLFNLTGCKLEQRERKICP